MNKKIVRRIMNEYDDATIDGWLGEVVIIDSKKFMEDTPHNIGASFKLEGQYVILIDTNNISIMEKLYVVYHELGHIKNGDLDLEDPKMDLESITNREFKADMYAVKNIGKGRCIEAMGKVFNKLKDLSENGLFRKRINQLKYQMKN